MRELFKS
jgi:hypothetical protein